VFDNTVDSPTVEAVPGNNQIQQGKIIHDAAQRMTLTRELDYKVRVNVQTITQMLHLMKLQAKETGMLQQSVGNWINETRE
jgi:hypothetical protein